MYDQLCKILKQYYLNHHYPVPKSPASTRVHVACVIKTSCSLKLSELAKDMVNYVFLHPTMCLLLNFYFII